MISTKFLFVFATLLVAVQCKSLGGSGDLKGAAFDEAKQTLETALSILAAGEGPDYKLSDVTSIQRRVVSGTSTVYNVDLIAGNDDVVPCTVTIWSRAWLKANEITFDCQNLPQLVKSYTA